MKTFTPKDSINILTAVLAQMQGGSISNIAINDFVSIGEAVKAHGVDNVFEAMALVALEMWSDDRMYSNRLRTIEVNKATFNSRRRKLLVYDKGAEESGHANTDLNAENLYNGHDNTYIAGKAVSGMFKQNKPVIETLDFGSMNTIQFSITEYGTYWDIMFNSPEEFAKVWNAIFANFFNEMEQTREARVRANMLHYFALLYDKGFAVDLVAQFNAQFGTTYTGSDLRGTYLKEYTTWKTAYIEKLSRALENRDLRYHWSPQVVRDGVTYNKVMKFTPKEDQRLILHVDNLVYPEKMVLPEIFHNEGLKINADFVDYWQTPDAETAINITPDVNDTYANQYAQIVGSPVALDHVVGAIFDKNACFSTTFIEKVIASPREATRDYVNRFYHTCFGDYADTTEKGILLYEAT